MRLVSKTPALGGMLNPFKEIVKDSKKITFIGTPGFCTPFAELLAFVIKDKEMAFIPGLNFEKAKKIEFTSYGMQLSRDIDPKADTVVVLGGLAIPKIGVDAREIKNLVDRITNGKGLKIGVCFMGVFEKSGWLDILDFDYLINSTIENELWKK